MIIDKNDDVFTKEELRKILESDLVYQRQHNQYVNVLGFKKVKSRCPVCYTEDLIRKNLIKKLKIKTNQR